MHSWAALRQRGMDSGRAYNDLEGYAKGVGRGCGSNVASSQCGATFSESAALIRRDLHRLHRVHRLAGSPRALVCVSMNLAMSERRDL